jgi:hypothetical protein
VFGEWALWGSDNPGFVNQLFGWIGRHSRVRMVVYNQGALTDGPFRLKRYPRSRAALRRRSRTAATSRRRLEAREPGAAGRVPPACIRASSP